MQFYCPQTVLSLYFQCRDDISESEQTFEVWKELFKQHFWQSHSTTSLKLDLEHWGGQGPFTKESLLRQSIIKHSETTTEPPNLCSWANLHRKGVALVQYINIWQMAKQGYATDVLQAIPLANSRRAHVLIFSGPGLWSLRTDATVHYKNCTLTDKVTALENQTLAFWLAERHYMQHLCVSSASTEWKCSQR